MVIEKTIACNRKNDRLTNPPSRSGSISRFAKCGSMYHWVKNCLDKGKESYSSAQITASNDISDDCAREVHYASLPNVLLEESLGKAVIDTACTSTVCGEHWLEDFAFKLPEKTGKYQKVQIYQIIIFWGWRSCELVMFCHFARQNWRKLDKTLVEVLNCSLPLLFSITTLRKLRTNIILNGKTDSFEFLREQIETHHSTSDVMVRLIDNCNYAFVCRTHDVLSDSQLQKLRIQFAHYNEVKLIQLLQNACKSRLSKHERETLERISRSCEICPKHGRCQPKPIVALPMATRFNQCVSMDLHELTEIQPHIWYFQYKQAGNGPSRHNI